ncbi:hypothetical protein W59_23795 [Rhodococcus opacus RKJ300 = JCM 13270]|uniref:Chorismate lyase n=1 Tax=Rhodococcus opacus RKJ300 = JCM 13270 TaxID=1165867 RepID=I0WM11_RHOOP|nr:hypothetical protein W59_23795 [Rhodococcus opacus RKJ300 = JCM 13270]
MDSRDIDDAQDLDQAVRTISLWARDTDNFTQIVSRWLQCPVEYVLLSQSRRTVTEEHATALDIPIDSVALHRHGLLQVTSPGSPIVVADVRATVVERRLSPSAQEALRQGKIPLGVVLGEYRLRRHTRAVTPTAEEDCQGQQALRVKATLTTAGELVAVVDETIYRRLLNYWGTPPGHQIEERKEA